MVTNSDTEFVPVDSDLFTVSEFDNYKFCHNYLQNTLRKVDLINFFSKSADEYSTFRFYTVNGYPCKKGTKCEKNKIAGFWGCETEVGGYDSWDYCCAPTHHCGFSQGYHYPWYIITMR